MIIAIVAVVKYFQRQVFEPGRENMTECGNLINRVRVKKKRQALACLFHGTS
jgi:diaminopimelate decarboxylase